MAAHKFWEESYGIRDLHPEYKKAMKGMRTLHIDTYARAMKRFFQLLAVAIVKERYHFHMPRRLGLLRIGKKRYKNHAKKVDWEATMKTGKWCKHKNMHSDGNFFYWSWGRKREHNAYFTNQVFYRFKPVKLNRQLLYNWIMECSEDKYKRDYDVLP